jgi:hypothetical protein
MKEGEQDKKEQEKEERRGIISKGLEGKHWMHREISRKELELGTKRARK